MRDRMGCVLPDAVDRWIADFPDIGELAGEIARGWFELPARPLGAWQRLHRNLSLYETTPARLKHIVDVILRPSLADWSRWPLPRALFVLYLPLRAWRLLGKQIRA